MRPRKDDICSKCGNMGHWARDCDVSFDAYYKRVGKPDRKKIYLEVPFHEKDFAKSHGARWDAEKRKWFVWDEVPGALREFEPLRTYTYIKPEETIDGLCRYCFFSFEEGLVKSKSDPKACIYCAPKKQPPVCKHCNKFMVADTWTGNMDDESIVVIHDCVGNPLMYDGGCCLMGGCRNRPVDSSAFLQEFAMRMSAKERLRRHARDGIETALRAEFPDTLRVIERGTNELIFDLDPNDSVDSFLEKHDCGHCGNCTLILPEPMRFRTCGVRHEPWVFDPKFHHPHYRACDSTEALGW